MLKKHLDLLMIDLMIILTSEIEWLFFLGLGKFSVDDIDPTLCTHIVYSFADLDPNDHVIKAHDTWLDLDRSGGFKGWNLGGYSKFTALKKSGTF